MSQQLIAIRSQVFGLKPAFESALSDKSMKFEAEAGFAIQAMENNSYLAGIAVASPESMRAAVTNVAAIGVSLNPAKKQAYLVPRKNKVCLDISYIGLMDLATATGAIMLGQAVVVRAADTFQLVAMDEKPVHQFDPFAAPADRGVIRGVYVVVKTASGDYLTHTMPIDSVYAIRDRSDAWKAYKSKGTSCPWLTDEEEMIKKTCVKQAYKYWPKNSRLEEAIHHMNNDGGEGITFEKPVAKSAQDFANASRPQGEDTPEILAIIADLKGIAENMGESELKAKWGSLTPDQRKAVGADRWAEIKALLITDAEYTEVQQ